MDLSNYTLTERVAGGCALLFLLAVAGFFVAFWWSGVVPRRPRNVRAGAVFLWAPAVGFPAPRRGWWLACWQQENGQDECRLSGLDGSLEYQGAYVAFRSSQPVAGSQLRIDRRRTGGNLLWLQDASVPLVYLQNGEILIPVQYRREAIRALPPSSH